MTSSIDPTAEIAAILSRLQALTDGATYMGIPQGFQLPVDGFGKKLPYRDFEPGGVIPKAGERMLAAGEQAQPHVWAFQIHHYAPTRDAVTKLSIASDKALMGWAPSDASSPIGTFYFTMYDEFSKNGERVGYVASRFYETTLGQMPDL